MNRSTRRAVELVLTFSAPAILLAVWEVLSRTERINPLFWPPPSSLWDTFTALVRDGFKFDQHYAGERGRDEAHDHHHT